MGHLTTLPKGFSEDKSAIASIDSAVENALRDGGRISASSLPEYARTLDFLQTLFKDWQIHNSYEFPSLLNTLIGLDRHILKEGFSSYEGIILKKENVPIGNLVVTQPGINEWKAEKFISNPEHASYPIQAIANPFERRLSPYILAGNTRTTYLWNEGIKVIGANIAFPIMNEKDLLRYFGLQSTALLEYERKSLEARGLAYPTELPAFKGIRGMWIVPENNGKPIPAEIYFPRAKQRKDYVGYKEAAESFRLGKTELILMPA